MTATEPKVITHKLTAVVLTSETLVFFSERFTEDCAKGYRYISRMY